MHCLGNPKPSFVVVFCAYRAFLPERFRNRSKTSSTRGEGGLPKAIVTVWAGQINEDSLVENGDRSTSDRADVVWTASVRSQYAVSC